LFDEEYKEKHQEVKFDDIPKMPCWYLGNNVDIEPETM
jgi:hypothetical protein